MQCLIVTTVSCERLFSVMNLIKTKQRNLLENRLLNSLLMISENWQFITPNREEFITLIIDHWNREKVRYFK